MVFFCVFFFFSSRRRHTRCALVTGVQTCALPISASYQYIVVDPAGDPVKDTAADLKIERKLVTAARVKSAGNTYQTVRSEERRVGKECVSTCRSRWSPYH